MARMQGTLPTTHIVESGDTLFDLAEAYYGDSNQWQQISDANNNLAPESLIAGQEVNIPVCKIAPMSGRVYPVRRNLT